jgi:hypothetical protein
MSDEKPCPMCNRSLKAAQTCLNPVCRKIRREVAAMVLQGLVAAPTGDAAFCATAAVEYADALLAELDKGGVI